MSGVYIKGMEMPKNCAACRIGHRDTGWDNEDNECEIVFCPIINQGSCLEDAEAKKHRLCPLVPVPEHGRVIDADKIGLTNFEIILCQKGNPYKNALEMLLKKIENAPTIIPAENGEI